jgi:hypothetical protein
MLHTGGTLGMDAATSFEVSPGCCSLVTVFHVLTSLMSKPQRWLSKHSQLEVCGWMRNVRLYPTSWYIHAQQRNCHGVLSVHAGGPN